VLLAYDVSLIGLAAEVPEVWNRISNLLISTSKLFEEDRDSLIWVAVDSFFIRQRNSACINSRFSIFGGSNLV
jgi:hypothetical protein